MNERESERENVCSTGGGMVGVDYVNGGGGSVAVGVFGNHGAEARGLWVGRLNRMIDGQKSHDVGRHLRSMNYRL